MGTSTPQSTPPPIPYNISNAAYTAGQPSEVTHARTLARMQGTLPGQVVPAQNYIILPPRAIQEPRKTRVTISTSSGDEPYIQLDWPNGYQELKLEGQDLAAYQAEQDPTSINALIRRQ